MKSNITASFPIYNGARFVGNMIYFMTDVEISELKKNGRAILDIKMPSGEVRAFNCILCRVDDFINVAVVCIDSNDFKFSFKDDVQPLLKQQNSKTLKAGEITLWTVNLVPGLQVLQAKKTPFLTLDLPAISGVCSVMFVVAACIVTYISKV